MTERQVAIQRVKKLRALASSNCSRQERQTAMRAAEELVDAHSLIERDFLEVRALESPCNKPLTEIQRRAMQKAIGISRGGEVPSMKALALAAGISVSTAAQLVPILERKGYVGRAGARRHFTDRALRESVPCRAICRFQEASR